MREKRKIPFLRLAAVCLAILFLAAALALSLHDCDGDGCAICALLTAFFVVLLPTAAVFFRAAREPKTGFSVPLRAVHTPVTGKTVIRC